MKPHAQTEGCRGQVDVDGAQWSVARATTTCAGLLLVAAAEGGLLVLRHLVSHARARDAAADVTVACGGASTTEAADRASLALDQEAFLVAIAAATPTVLVALAPGAVLLPDDDAVATIMPRPAWSSTTWPRTSARRTISPNLKPTRSRC